MKTNKEIVCIICPNGCRLNVFIDEQNIVTKVTNALCRNGKTYAESEIQCPMRSLTSTVKVIGGTMPLVSVRSNVPMPKEKIQEAVRELKNYELTAPVEFHQVVVTDILGTGANIIATKQVPKA